MVPSALRLGPRRPLRPSYIKNVESRKATTIVIMIHFMCVLRFFSIPNIAP